MCLFVCPAVQPPPVWALGYWFMLYSSSLQIKKLANSNRLFHFCSTTNPPVQRKDCHCKACTLSSNQQALALKSSLLKSKTIQIRTLILNNIIIAQKAHFVNELFTIFLRKNRVFQRAAFLVHRTQIIGAWGLTCFSLGCRTTVPWQFCEMHKCFLRFIIKCVKD